MIRTLTALGTALLIAGTGTGAAYAQTGAAGNPPPSVTKGAEGTPGTTTLQKNQQNNATGAVKNPAGAESTTGSVTGGAAFDRSAVGQTVFNRNGDAIGQVKAVQGDKITVSVGSYLGVGTRDIMLGRSQMDTKTGSNNKLTTTLNKDELAAQPEVGMNNSTTGSTNTRSGTVPGNNPRPAQRDGTSGTTTAPAK